MVSYDKYRTSLMCNLHSGMKLDEPGVGSSCCLPTGFILLYTASQIITWEVLYVLIQLVLGVLDSIQETNSDLLGLAECSSALLNSAWLCSPCLALPCLASPCLASPRLALPHLNSTQLNSTQFNIHSTVGSGHKNVQTLLHIHECPRKGTM